MPFSVVVFDGWFLHNDLIDSIEAAGKDWIGGCPKDRLVLVQGQSFQLQAYLATIPATAYRPTQVHDQLYSNFTKVLTVKSLRSRRIRIVASFDKPDLKDQPPCWLPTARIGNARGFCSRMATAGQPKLSTRTPRGTWALKIISYASYVVSGATGTWAW